MTVASQAILPPNLPRFWQRNAASYELFFVPIITLLNFINIQNSGCHDPISRRNNLNPEQTARIFIQTMILKSGLSEYDLVSYIEEEEEEYIVL